MKATPTLAYAGAARMERLSESQTLALAKRVREMRAEGKDVVSLTLGEPDFDTPLHIRQAAIAAIEASFTHYPPVAGIAELREAVANNMRTRNQLPYQAENIVVSTGAKQSIINVIMSLVNPGDEVILAAPYWVSYYPMVMMAEGVPVVVQTTAETGLKLTPALLEEAITPRTRMVILNTPSNPTGMMYSQAELEGLAQVLVRHPQVFVLADEIYELIAYEMKHFSIGSLPDFFERTITINGLSKGYAMTGWRMGFAAAPKWIAALCEKFQGQITSGANSIAQKAAVAALTQDTKPSHDMVATFKARRDLLCGLLKEHCPELKFVKPDGAFYLYPDCGAYLGQHTPNGQVLQSCDDLALYLLNDALVSVVPGTAFGTDSHVRLSYACSNAEIETAAQRMGMALKQLK